MQEAHHGQTPGATLLTAATKLWHEPSLPPEAVIVHWLAYWALTTASSGQQDDRLAQAPAEEPPPEALPLLEPVPAAQVDAQLADKQVKTGPSQVAQVPLMQAVTCDVHIASTQLAHAIVYPPNTVSKAHVQPDASSITPPPEEE